MEGQAKKKAGASIIFLNSFEEVLLCLRDNNEHIPFPDCWDLLGGYVEEGETPLECIRREMREEIEVELEHPRLFRVYDLHDRFDYTFWQRQDFDLRTLRLHEGQRLEWFSEEGILKLPLDKIAYGFRGILLDFYREKPWQRVSDR
jgi:8-oxo-dGTP diphosphatase